MGKFAMTIVVCVSLAAKHEDNCILSYSMIYILRQNNAWETSTKLFRVKIWQLLDYIIIIQVWCNL